MKNSNKKARVLWVVGAVIALLLSFLLCRFVFFEFHGNKQWPVIMLVIGLVAAGNAAVFNSKIMMVCTVAGYLGGFFIGLLQGVDVVDPGGGMINDWWVKWTISFFAIVAIGVISELIGKIIIAERRS